MVALSHQPRPSSTAGAAATTSEATLTSTRNIGILQVTTGALNIQPGGSDDGRRGDGEQWGYAQSQWHHSRHSDLERRQLPGHTSARFELTLGATSDQVIASVAGQSFSLSNVTIAINGAAPVGTYLVFSGFTGTNTVSGVTFTGVPSGETAVLTTDGNITITAAVPEPATTSLCVAAVLMLAAFWVRRSKRVKA